MQGRGIELSSGRILPQVGLGTWKLGRPRVAEIVVEAARQGYRHLDCACDYGNEVEVGAGLRQGSVDEVGLAHVNRGQKLQVEARPPGQFLRERLVEVDADPHAAGLGRVAGTDGGRGREEAILPRLTGPLTDTNASAHCRRARKLPAP